MDKKLLESIENFKDCSKDDEKTKEIVGNYLNCKHGYISNLEELLWNLRTGVNAHLINYELAEQEFNRIRTKA